ncbi:MAG: TIGR01777 family oxidoreductase [Thermodesulfovibrionales bacterium]|nr:TIGR01777 family oxidoreductase [Thermodesulfovibrionales bacterium]
MRISMTGATGFIGKNLTKAFTEKSWSVVPITVEDFKAGKEVLTEKLSKSDVVVNLAGAPIVAKWTEEYKKILYSSRIDTTHKVVEIISHQEPKPKVFISTSAVGRYDDKGIYSEDDAAYATDFLGYLTEEWEKSALKAKEAGIRTIIFRFGIVLGKDGGILAKMLPFFKLGLGGTIGDGNQGFSWVHINDLTRAYMEVINNEKYEGIYNLTAPNPTTNRGLTKALGKILGVPTIFKIPLIALKLKFGDGAIVIASGQKVIPKRLLESGFHFQFETIEEALKDIIKGNVGRTANE